MSIPLPYPYVVEQGGKLDAEGVQSDLDALALASGVPAVEARHAVGASGEPAFQNSFANQGGGATPLTFYKDRERVYVSGRIKTGNNAVVCTFPTGYRPATTEYFTLLAQGGVLGYCYVTTTGNLYVAAPNAGDNSLAFSFRVA